MTIAQRLADVLNRIASSCAHHHISPARIALIAVSKTFPIEAILQAHKAGQRDFGENYVQEGLEKISALADIRKELTWHFIGPLQSNKTKDVAEHFDWMHTIEREKIAKRLSEQRPNHQPPLQVCIQVNVSGESSKSGVSPQEAKALALEVAHLPGLELRGLMAIPEPDETPEAQQRPFAQLRRLAAEIRAALPPQKAARFDVLSMGMSADLESAIAESSDEFTTLVRVGSAIFGPRPAKP